MKRNGNSKIAVVGWGRGMGHKGHMYLADAVITQANEMRADPYFFVSKTVGKDDPVFPEEKVRIYQKVFPQYAPIFTPQGNLNQALQELAQLGYQGVVVVVGADQKKAFQYLEGNNKEGVPVYQSLGLKKLRVISRQETNSKFANEEGPRATPMREILLNPNASEEDKFKVWRRDMPDELGDREVLDIMNKAESRLVHSNKPKVAKVQSMSKKAVKLKEAIIRFKENKQLEEARILNPNNKVLVYFKPNPSKTGTPVTNRPITLDMAERLIATYVERHKGEGYRPVYPNNFEIRPAGHNEYTRTEDVEEGIFGSKKPQEEYDIYLKGYDPHAVKKYLLSKFGSKGWRVFAANDGSGTVSAHINTNLYPSEIEAKVDLQKNCRQQGVTEDDVWGPQGNFAGDKPVELGNVTMKQIQVGDTVMYIDQKAKVLAMSKDRKYSRINIQTGMGGITKDVLTSDLKQLDQGVVNEFSPDDSGDSGQEDMFFKYAKMWYNGNNAVKQRVEEILAQAGWEIGPLESEEGGAFIVQSGDEDGDTYMGWSAEELGGKLNEFAPGNGGDGDRYVPPNFGKPYKSRYLRNNQFDIWCETVPDTPSKDIQLKVTVDKSGLDWDGRYWYIDSPGGVHLKWKYGDIPLPGALDQAGNPGHIHDLISDFLNKNRLGDLQDVAKYYGFTDGEMNEDYLPEK